MANIYANYGSVVLNTPQSQPIPGREAEMVPNNAGGYGFVLDDWERLHRFLILGSELGTYYVGEQKLTAENAATVIRCIKADGVRTVETAREVNVNNRAPKTDQQLFVLALAMKHGDEATKAAVAVAAPSMLRTGTHLLHFVAMLDGLGGWNRSKRRLVASWFENREADWVAFQVLKYQNRDSWTQRDVLRVAHPTPPTEKHRAVYQWACGREVPLADLPAILATHKIMQNMETASLVEKALFGIENNLPREALPTEALNDPAVWHALLPQTPIHALIRNLGNLTEKGIIANGNANSGMVAAKLTDADGLKKARVHPFAILLATLIYKGGTGIRGSKTWAPVKAIMDALEDAYDSSFATVKPTGKRILVAIDISSSMTHACVGTPISCSTAAAAMAITLARSEPNAMVVQFDTAVQAIKSVTKRTGIASLEATSGGGTDVASAVLWALGANPTHAAWGSRSRTAGHGPAHPTEPFDAFVILTDSETWAGNRHTSQALETYRRKVNPKAKLVCCSMAANHANVVDPNDPLSLGCAGLDANLPSIVAEFISA